MSQTSVGASGVLHSSVHKMVALNRKYTDELLCKPTADRKRHNAKILFDLLLLFDSKMILKDHEKRNHPFPESNHDVQLKVCCGAFI